MQHLQGQQHTRHTKLLCVIFLIAVTGLLVCYASKKYVYNAELFLGRTITELNGAAFAREWRLPGFFIHHGYCRNEPGMVVFAVSHGLIQDAPNICEFLRLFGLFTRNFKLRRIVNSHNIATLSIINTIKGHWETGEDGIHRDAFNSGFVTCARLLIGPIFSLNHYFRQDSRERRGMTDVLQMISQSKDGSCWATIISNRFNGNFSNPNPWTFG